jgi:amino acid transporter
MHCHVVHLLGLLLPILAPPCVASSPGMLPYAEINSSAPFAAAFEARGARWMAIVVGFGSVCGILDTIVVTQYSMSRTFVILGRMGLVPPVLVSSIGLYWGQFWVERAEAAVLNLSMVVCGAGAACTGVQQSHPGCEPFNQKVSSDCLSFAAKHRP